MFELIVMLALAPLAIGTLVMILYGIVAFIVAIGQHIGSIIAFVLAIAMVYAAYTLEFDPDDAAAFYGYLFR